MMVRFVIYCVLRLNSISLTTRLRDGKLYMSSIRVLSVHWFFFEEKCTFFSLFFIEDFYDGMEEMRESYGDNIAFLYVSDDMKWGRANIKDKENDLYFVGMGSISNNVEVTTTG